MTDNASFCSKPQETGNGLPKNDPKSAAGLAIKLCHHGKAR
jgi:hypothetical protein